MQGTMAATKNTLFTAEQESYSTSQLSQNLPMLQDEDLALAKVLQEQEQMFLRLR